MLMRKLIFAIALIIFSTALHAQDSTSLSIMKQKVDSLQKRMDDGNYVRIPKQDFEKILNTAVADQVSSSIKGWIGFLATLIGLVGIFIAAYFKNQIKTQVDDSLKNQLGDINARIDRLNEKEKYENDRQDKKLAELTERIDNLLANQTSFVNDSTSIIDKKIKGILSFAWDDIADAKIKVAKEKNYPADLIPEIQSFLENKDIEIRNEKKIFLIDSLMRCYYNNYKETEDERYKKMIVLLRKYETDLELLPETYASAAIALANNYEKYGVKADRDTCMESCDKSLNRLKDYGTPYALKLEVLMTDYKKAYDDKEKQEIVESIKRTFNAIENNNSKFLCMEIIERLNADRAVLRFKKYIDKLEEMFADELAIMRERVCSDILLDRKYFSQDRHTKLSTDILYDHMLKSPNLDGNWTCSKLVKSGTELDPPDDFQNLLLSGYEYSLNRNNDIEKGRVLFLPFSNMQAINFYTREGDAEIYTQLIRCIYKIENDQLVICFNAASDERPVDFSSTQENKYTVMFYNKAA